MKEKINKKDCITCKYSMNNKKDGYLCVGKCIKESYCDWEPSEKRCVFCVNYPDTEEFHSKETEKILVTKECLANFWMENRLGKRSRKITNKDFAQRCPRFRWKYPELMELKNLYSMKDGSKMSVYKETGNHIYWPQETEFKQGDPVGVIYPFNPKENKLVGIAVDPAYDVDLPKPEYKHICPECTKQNKKGCPFYKLEVYDANDEEKIHPTPRHITTCSAFESLSLSDRWEKEIIGVRGKKMMVFGTRKYKNDIYDYIKDKEKCNYIWNELRKPKESCIESITQTKDGNIIPKFKDKINKVKIKGGGKDMEDIYDCSTCKNRTKKAYEKPCCNCGSYGHYEPIEEINNIKIKGGVENMEDKGLEDFKEHLKNDLKIAETKEEIEKVKKLIIETNTNRITRIKESEYRNTLKLKNKYKVIRKSYKMYTIKKEFLEFLKEKGLYTYYKKLKQIKIRTGYYEELYSKRFSKEEWEEFEKILCIIDEYYPKYELHKEQKKLCRLTDCYKKLATEKTCYECGSVNPITAIFCNQCGTKI